MANRATTDAIQKDWKEREMIEVVHLNILKVGEKLSPGSRRRQQKSNVQNCAMADFVLHPDGQLLNCSSVCAC